MIITQSVVDRLQRNHTKVGDCWLWNKSVRGGGYGYMKIKGKKYVATRVSYTHYKGEIPNGYFVCHKCDTPSCINPDHLFVGTQKDNMQDKIAKGRTGNTRVHNTKLKIMDVVTIRSCMESGISNKDIARYYKLDRRYVLGLQRGDYWKDVTGGVPTSNYRPSNYLTALDIQVIKEALDKGFVGRQIAKYFNTTPSTISRINRNGKVLS